MPWRVDFGRENERQFHCLAFDFSAQLAMNKKAKCRRQKDMAQRSAE